MATQAEIEAAYRELMDADVINRETVEYALIAAERALGPWRADKPCCTICDRKKVCHVCGDQTFMACSDCAINFGVTVYVCTKSACRDEHETKCFGDGHQILIPRAQYEALMAAAKALNETAEFDWWKYEAGESIYALGRLQSKAKAAVAALRARGDCQDFMG